MEKMDSVDSSLGKVRVLCLKRNNRRSWDWRFEFWDPSLMD